MQQTELPTLSRIDFYRDQESDLIFAIADVIATAVANNPELPLSDGQKAICSWSRLSADVTNGGFTQFFYNNRDEPGVAPLTELLDFLDLPKASELLRNAVSVFREHQSAFEVANPWEGLFGSISEFDKLENAFVRMMLRVDRAIEKWIRSHIREIAHDETGNPIDAKFTGVVEIPQSNGLVGEYLEVRNGKPHGAYRKFFADGTVSKVIFYKSGKVSGDFWADGQLKRKESKRSGNTIIEWFYSSGQLQKVYVKDKSDAVVEPVRTFYENGQLAEQINVVNREKLGPWLKFFPDGSPKLIAEFGPDEILIVHDAWNDDHVQVVKDGAGVFFDDRRDIDWEYAILLEHDRHTVSELRHGIRHGKTTEYWSGVLWSISSYVNGLQEGESTLYWDNGRVRSVAKYVQGEEIASVRFPKFDHPRPAVKLSVEANAKLYEAWKHMPVDEFPCCLNLAEIQELLEIPTFLREVYERNLAGDIKSEYESCDAFKDGVGYFLTVSEIGEVSSVSATASGVYSGGSWGVYPPFLQQLRFAPGRLSGKAVECRAIARVVHTFIEARPGDSESHTSRGPV